MNINIKTTTMSLTPAISDYIEKRFVNISKFLQSDSTARYDVELGKISNHHKQGDIFKAEIHIVGLDLNEYVNIEKEDLYSAIDIATDEVLSNIKSAKAKQRSLLRRGGARMKNIIKGFLR